MNRDLFLAQLKIALNEISSPVMAIETLQECPTSDLVLRTPCYIAFFVMIKKAELVLEICRKAQEEIVELKSLKGPKWPRDINLVFFLVGKALPDYASIRKLIDDRFVCRKFVLNLNGKNIRNVLADLPFWPPGELLSEEIPSVGADVQKALKGYDPNLIADLAGYSPGAERISQKIKEGAYSSTGEPSEGKLVQIPRLTNFPTTKLKALDITDFRGIRCLRPEDLLLSGDIVFIYGPNGVGKTSIVDAVEWAITGQVSRLHKTPHLSKKSGPDPIVNVFSESGEARVTCHLSDSDPVSRIKHGRSIKRLIGSHAAQDDRDLIDHVVAIERSSHKVRLRTDRLRDLFRGSHMLAQHDIRQFLEKIEPSERFDILTNMIGAEEFVRFREKVANVLRHLRSYLGEITDQSKSLKRELEDVSTRLRERKEDFKKLSLTVTVGKNPEDVANELLSGLKKCKCNIDEAAIEQTDRKSEERRLDLIVIHAESAIRNKKAETNDLLVRLKSLEQELKGYLESKKRCESLAAEIKKSKSDKEKAKSELRKHENSRQTIQTNLQVHRTNRSGATKRYTDLSWLKENLPTHRQNWEILQQTKESLKGLRENIQKSVLTLEKQQKSLSVKRTRLQEIQHIIAAKMKRGQAIATILKRLPNVKAKRQETEQLSRSEKQIVSQIVEQKRQAGSFRDELNATQMRIDGLQRAYNSEAARHDVLSSFLAKLEELVRSAECPLCGRDFTTLDQAKENIREHISVVPIQLRDLERRINEAKKDAEAKQSHVDTINAGIRTLEIKLDEIRLNMALGTKIVEDFFKECTDLSIDISLKDTVSWQDVLEKSSKECDVASLVRESDCFRESIESFASCLVNQQKAVDDLRQKLIHKEKEHTRLFSMIQELNAKMVQLGFDPASLPESDHLIANLSATQDEAKKYVELIAKEEIEQKAVESAITGLRENLMKIDEDVASKETQLQQYDTTCSRFIATCISIGVDPKTPNESISAIMGKVLETVQSLSSLEEKCRILQQIVSLGRLKKEIDGLSRIKDDVKLRTNEHLCEESQLHVWMSHIEGLESNVVREQVNVVGSHLEHLEPTTQRLYHKLNPHPIFGNVRIRVNEKKHELKVEAETSVLHEQLGDITISPSAFFSDAQMNSLAITVFLAGALRQRWSGFNTILIDDPIQQMDELNVCAFLDLIRGLSTQWQFIIFTCSRDFYLLALEKLDCLNKSRRGTFMAYRLEGLAPAELKVHCDTP